MKDPWHDQWQNAIGQRDHLSNLDIIGMQVVYPRPGDVFCDASYTGAIKIGTLVYPFKTFPPAAATVPVGGRVILKSGTYSGSAGVYTKAMTLRAPLGGVLLK